jgi:hypothetical protein
MSAQVQQALFGCNETRVPCQILQAGPVSLCHQGARFGPISVNGHEVWHGVEFLLRDVGWGTPATEVDAELLHKDAQGFDLQLTAHIPCSPEDVAGIWNPQACLSIVMRVRGDVQGVLHFSVQATPTHDIQVNRCGWVLIHPLSAAGCAVKVSHVDGRTSHSQFPQEVPAWPPFTNVKGICHEYAPGCWAQAELPGEDYELEDQRNNADASFKTYSRSNWMPRPYVLRQNQSWRRELHLRVVDFALAMPRQPTFIGPEDPGSGLSVPGGAGLMRLGLAISLPGNQQAEQHLLKNLEQWQPDFLHLTLWPSMPRDAVDWSQVRLLLDVAKAKLRIDICPRDNPHHEWCAEDESAAQQLAESMRQSGIAPSAVAALPCGDRAAQFLRSLFPTAAIGGGTPHFFAQLNRLDRSGGEDFMAFTVCPIVHSAEDASVMQGLQSLPSMLATARSRHPGREWHLGPSWLGARASPLGRQPVSDGCQRVPLAAVDPRSHGLFGAAWLLGHMAGAAQAGVNALTLPALAGDQASDRHGGRARVASPTEAMLEVCMQWQGLQAIELQPISTRLAPLFNWPLAAVMGVGPAGREILVANLTEQSQPLDWHHAGQWASMDAQSWSRYEASPDRSPWDDRGVCPPQLVLNPYAVARIDLPR